MKAVRRFFSRLRSFAQAGRNEDRLRAEIEEHLRLQIEDYVRSGLSPAEARRQAALKFGAIEAVKETWRDQRGLPFVETAIQETGQAIRRLRMAPAFTAATILILALGIGATTSIFTLAHAILMKSLPVANPGDLYRLGKEARCCYWGGSWTQEGEFSLVSYDLYKYLRDNSKSFAELAAFASSQNLFGVRRKGVAEPAQSYPGESVSGNYFSMFGVRPYAGRALSPDDDRTGAPAVAMMSYRLWEQKYASDPSVIGSVFNLNDTPYTVIGITPPGFFGDQLRNPPPDFFLPLHANDGPDLIPPNLYWLDVIGRLRPGAKPAPAEAELRAELKQWLRAHWGEMNAADRAKFAQQTLYLRPGGGGISTMRDDYERWLRTLLMVSGFVLLIVCANVANLMLVRGMERRRQTSLSMALGARPRRIVGQALTESVLLSLLGGAAGVAIAFAGARFILDLAFPRIPGLAAAPVDASPSLPVLAFALAVSIATGLAFGIGPAVIATRVDPIEALRGTGRSTVPTGSLTRRTLVVVQAALSLALLSASGLLATTLRRLENQDFGFAQDRRLVVVADPRQAGYRPDQLTPLYRRIRDSLSAIPAVSGVALCTYSPMGNNNYSTLIRLDGQAAPAEGNSSAAWNRVTPGYFDAIGDPIIRGRGITERDTDASPRVAVVSEAFAHRFYGNEDPIGRRFAQYTYPGQYEIVGVVRDARYFPSHLDRPAEPFFVLPEAQHDYLPGSTDELTGSSHFLRNIVVELRPGPNPSAAPPIAEIRQALASVDPNMPILSLRTMKEQVASQFNQQRLIARLTSLFGVLSLVLASIGLYGAIAYNAGRRTAEIGVRMAVGAGRGDIMVLVLRGALALIGAGLLAGLPLALAAGRFLGHQLYGIGPYDPVVLAAAGLVLAMSAVAASLIPAFRASLISPVEALRAD